MTATHIVKICEMAPSPILKNYRKSPTPFLKSTPLVQSGTKKILQKGTLRFSLTTITFFEASVFERGRYLHNDSTMLIPKFQISYIILFKFPWIILYFYYIF